MSRVSVALSPTPTTSNLVMKELPLGSGDRSLEIEEGDPPVECDHAAAVVLGAVIERGDTLGLHVDLFAFFDPIGNEAVVAENAMRHALRGIFVGVFVE